MAGRKQIVAIDFLGLDSIKGNMIDIDEGVDADPVKTEGRGGQRVACRVDPPARHAFRDAEFASLGCLKAVTGRSDESSVSSFSKRGVHPVRNGGFTAAVEPAGWLTNAKPVLSSLSLKGNASRPACFENININLALGNSVDNFQPIGGSFVLSSSSDAEKSCSKVKLQPSVSKGGLADRGLHTSERKKVAMAVKSLEELTDLQQIQRQGLGRYMNDKARSLHQVAFFENLDEEMSLNNNGQDLSEKLIPNFQLSQTEVCTDLQHGNAFTFQSTRENGVNRITPLKYRSICWGKEAGSHCAPCSRQSGSSLNHAIQMPEDKVSSAQHVEDGESVPDAALCLSLSNLKEHSACSQTDSIPVLREPPCNSQGKSLNAQLAIFYAGTVSAYDDIPADKAQDIMLFAGSGNMLPAQGLNTLGVRSISSTAPAYISSLNGVSLLTGTVSPLPVTRVLPQLLQSGLQTGQLSPSGQSAAASSQSMHNCGPVALPQARKASLARFLEKRRERVLSKMLPYPIKKFFPECTSMPGENVYPTSVGIFAGSHKQKLGSLCGNGTRMLLGDLATCKMDK